MNTLTPRAAKALELARREAERTGHKCPGTGHLLLGLSALEAGSFLRFLDEMGLNRDTLRAEAEKSLAHACTDEDALSGLTTPCAALVSSAHEEANRMGYSYTGTEHLLLALIREKDGVLRKALETRGLDLEAMRRKIIEFLQGPAASSPLEASTMLALRHFQADLRRAVEDLSKKFDTVVEAVATLKSDLAQLRADVLKGNS